jgi:hypothetical protein
VTRLGVAAIAIALAWFGPVVITFAIVVAVMRPDVRLDRIVLIGLTLLIGFGFAGRMIGTSIRCPSCGAGVLHEPTGPVHPRAVRLPMLNYWATAIVRVLRGGPLVCWQCGNRIVVGGAVTPAVAPTVPSTAAIVPSDGLVARHRMAIRAGSGVHRRFFARACPVPMGRLCDE